MSRLSNFLKTTPGIALAGAIVFAAGGGLGAAVTEAVAPVHVMAPGAPIRIATLGATTKPLLGDPIVTVRGRVAETYGGRFVLDDGSGRALIDAGPERDAALVALNQTVTVQGRYGDGMVHAAYLVGADGQVTALERHHRGPGDRDDRGDRHDGPRGHGDRDHDRAPPQPPAAAPAGAPPAN